MAGGEVRNIAGDIQMVQNLIQQCMSHYMTQRQIVDILYQQEKIEPSFTELVWQRLEERNQEYFEGYHLRLMVKDQIIEFNKLLDRQAALMHQLTPPGVAFQPKTNGSRSRLPPMNQTTTCYASENVPRGFASCAPSVHSGMQNPLPNMVLGGQNSNVGIKTEARSLGDSRFVYGADGDNLLDASPTIGETSVSSFGCMDSDSHQLNETILNDNSLFGLLGQMSQNFSQSDLTVDFSNSSDMLESFSRSAFLSSDRDNFLDSHSSTVENQGENKRLDMPENLGFGDFGSD